MKHRISFSTALLIAIALLTIACNDAAPDATSAPKANRNAAGDSLNARGAKIAFIYGDTINDKYNFLIDAQDELETERKRIDERLRKKLERAEARAQELQSKAATMTQIQMQEAQLELQNLDLEMQQFQESLSNDFRKREIQLQEEYVNKVDSFLDGFNDDGRYDMILNFQRGGNLLWINDAFDITEEVLTGLNAAYDEDISAKAAQNETK